MIQREVLVRYTLGRLEANRGRVVRCSVSNNTREFNWSELAAERFSFDCELSCSSEGGS
jgi:hypothetical protein